MDEVGKAIHRVLDAAIEEMESGDNTSGVRITIERALSFTNPNIEWGLRIERERKTATGRQGKPDPITLLVNNPGERPADMLRMLADFIDANEAAVT